MIHTTGPADCLTVTGEGEAVGKLIAGCFDVDN